MKRARVKSGRLVSRVTPNYPDTLKAIPVGESYEFDITGRIAQSMGYAAWKLKRKGVGSWETKTDPDRNKLIVTRTA